MEFRILGPVEVADGGSLVALPGAQRALLAALLLNANQVVSSDHLIEELWAGHSPQSGRTALQVRISQLRKSLGDRGALVVTRAPGYVIQVDTEQLDLARFERLVAEGDAAAPSVAASKFREALSLWRGPALADLAFESFTQPAIARMEELRVVAIEKRIDADIALGRHADVVGELEELSAEHPLREGLRAQLMLAMYRCGRQADALAVYQNARQELVEELGIEPSQALRELEQAILRQDTELDLAPSQQRPARGQTAEIPPRLVARRNNLPAQLSSFVGRERELGELKELLSHTRALTLVGAGGVGKTRLAMELGCVVTDQYKDGVWFVDLAPLADPSLVARKVASVFEVTEAPGRQASESVVVALRARELLVILDNCEHVIESAAILAGQLVTDCPSVSVVSTSREPLRIAGEQIYRVPSLSLPAAGEDDPDCLPDSEAVRLFVDRAHQQRPGFVLDSSNCVPVARLCRRLDGIPLAIELAAARLRAIPVEDVERRLDQRFALLTGGDRSALPRQRTLQALIDWSYNLLNPSEQEVLDRLSVFTGGFDLQGAEAVASRGQGVSVLAEVLALVDKSLVHWDDTNNRYRLLESIREYAAAKLLARGEIAARAVGAAHRDYYLELAEAAAPHLIGHGQAEWLDRLELELDNLRAAITECAADSDPEPGLRLVHALCYFWVYRDPGVEGARAVCEALDRADAQAPTLVRGRALVTAAHLVTLSTAEYDAEIKRAREALTIGRTTHDESLQVEALCRLLTTSVFVGDEETHATLSNEAVDAARALGDPHLTAQVLYAAASSTRVTHGERALALNESLELTHQTGDQVLHIRILGALGYDAMEAGDIAAAHRYLEQAVVLVRETGDPGGLTTCTLNLGFVSYLDGADAAAKALFEEALDIARRSGDMYMVAHAQLGLALITARAGDKSGAATLHGIADAIHEKLGTRFVAVESNLRRADIAALRARLGDVAFERAYAAGHTIGASGEPALV